MPETAPGIRFDDMGICSGCQSHEQKMRINWKVREEKFRETLNRFKEQAGDNYDCLVPISGGKDSIFQLHIITRIYGMQPLAVTFSHNWFSETGWYNLWNCLEKMDVDHVMFTPSRSKINKLAKKSLCLIGDSCWHCHRGVDAFPFQMAVTYDIPLIIWGESTADGASGRKMHSEVTLDSFGWDYMQEYSTRAKLEDMVGDDVTFKDLRPFQKPSVEELKRGGVSRIFLSDYMFWDPERAVEFVKEEYGWREDDIEGTFKKYKSVECIMPGVHDYSKFVKRGYGRATDFASQDARAGLMSREEALEIARQIDPKRPEVLDYYLEITGYTEDEFYQILMDQREDKAKDLPDPRSLFPNTDAGTDKNDDNDGTRRPPRKRRPLYSS